MIFKHLWAILGKENERRSLIVFFILLVVSLLELTGLALVIPYVNIMLGTQDSSTVILDVYNYVESLEITDNVRFDASLLFACFYIVKNGTLIGLVFIQNILLKNIQANIVNRIFSYYIYQPFTFHLTTRSSKLLRTITYDAQNLTDGMFVQVATLITEILLLIGVLLILSLQNQAALLVMVMMVIPIVLIYMFVKRYLVSWAIVLQKREEHLIKNLQEGLGGIKDAIILGKRAFFEHNFHHNVRMRSYVKRKRDVALLVPRYVIETLMMVAMAVALVWMDRSQGLVSSLPDIAFLAVVTVRMLPMSNRILSSLGNIKTYTPSVNVIYETLKNEKESESYQASLNQHIDSGSKIKFTKLSLSNVSFSYENNNNKVLENISIDIKKGEMVGLAGGSGAGKTTLVNLILGLLRPISGDINVNGENIHGKLNDWHKILGYVPQSVFLLDGTIEENIAYGIAANDIDHERVSEVMRLAQLTDWVGTLKYGIQSIVGEQGVQISGGQRQRIGIARALYQNPEILVFDEATSALDNLTEKGIMDDIYKMHGDRTIIIIAHRLDTIRRCDRIIVLDNGNLVGNDTYDSLLDNNTAFQRISFAAHSSA